MVKTLSVLALAFLAGCSASQTASADRAFEREQAIVTCAADVEAKFGLLEHPEKLTVKEALAAAKALAACTKPAETADAGASQ